MLLVRSLAVNPARSERRKTEWGYESVVEYWRDTMREGVSARQNRVLGWEEGVEQDIMEDGR